MARSIKDIYAAFNDGDKLTDKELELAEAHFDDLADLLALSGPVFHLATNEARRVSMAMQGFIAARKSR